MKKTLYYLLYLVVTIFLIFLMGEFILTSAFHLTRSDRFNNLVITDRSPEYPANPKEYIKIAVFGGSAAAGYNAERNFSDVLDYELKKRYPELNIYVKNFAANGATFHRQQAELLEMVIDRYDIFLIYVGNNEINIYLDDVGYFRSPENRNKKAYKGIKSRSRVYAFIKKAIAWYEFKKQQKRELVSQSDVAITAKGNEKSKTDSRRDKIYRYDRFKEFNSQGVMPDIEFEKIKENFKNDLERVARFATKRNKCIVLSSVPTNEILKPFFSVRKETLSDQEREVFQENYDRGLASFNRNDFKGAIQFLLKANEIDSDVAIVNYMLGHSYRMINNHKKAHEFLMKASDNDGYPIRAPSWLFAIEKSISEEYDSVYFVDSVKAFHDLEDNGIAYDELFSDYHHPSFLGHIALANVFLSKLAELEPFRSYSIDHSLFDLDSRNLTTLLPRYKKELAISNEEEAKNNFLISRWFISMAAMSAYPDEMALTAKNNIIEFYSKSDKSQKNEAKKLIFLALVEGELTNGDYQKAYQLVKEAYRLTPDFVDTFLYKNLCLEDLIIEKLNAMNIQYENGMITLK